MVIHKQMSRLGVEIAISPNVRESAVKLAPTATLKNLAWNQNRKVAGKYFASKSS